MVMCLAYQVAVMFVPDGQLYIHSEYCPGAAEFKGNDVF